MSDDTSPRPLEENGGAMVTPYVAPFIAFLVLTQLESFESTKPYYPWLYAAKIGVVTAICIFLCRSWPAFSTRGFGLGVGFGIFGVVAWVLIANLRIESWLAENIPLVASMVGARVGYNPWESIPSSSGAIAFIAVRLFGLAVIVPIIEEVFWRGFLLRYLIDEKFTSVAIGTYTTFSFLVVTALFALVHPEILAAIVWGAGINLLCYQTKNLWACVVGHGVTNLLLGLYVLQSGHWSLW